jgi:hypothetical protein
MRFHGLWALHLQAGFYTPKGVRSHIASFERLFWATGRFCGHHMMQGTQDKTHTEFGGQRISPLSSNCQRT